MNGIAASAPDLDAAREILLTFERSLWILLADRYEIYYHCEFCAVVLNESENAHNEIDQRRGCCSGGLRSRPLF
jgi:hypothetical protein